jgi:two-component sensor histidine kinase
VLQDGLGAALLSHGAWFRERPMVAYATSLMGFVIALGVRFALNDVLPSGFPYLTFFPAVLLTAFFCGTGPGIVTAVLSVLSAWYWFIPPAGTFALDGQSAIAVLFFVAILTADIVIIHVMNVALRGLGAEQVRTAALLDQQRTLFEELQHRTANNMSFIGALLSMHKRRVRGEPEAVSAFEDAATRLDSMARIHRRLYDPTNIDLPVDTYLAELLRDVLQSAGNPDVRISVQSGVSQLDVNRLITLSLIVSELATNAAKHAFRNGNGEFSIILDRIGPDYVLVARDNGPGFPEGFDPRASDRLGFRVLSSFARTLDGTLTFHSDGGAVTKLTFPAADPRALKAAE